MKMPSHPQQSIIGNSVQQPVTPNNNQTLKKVIELLKTDNGGPGGERHGTQSSERLMELLKTNPRLMASIIMQRNAIKQGSQAQPPQQQHYIPQTNMTSIGSVQQQSMSGVGVQQVPMQSSINQLGMNMPVEGSDMQPMHWQQQQQQQRRIQLQHQPSQGQFQTPAPPYPQQAQGTSDLFITEQQPVADEEIKNIFASAERIENDIYERISSRAEYYCLIEETISDIMTGEVERPM